MPNIVQKKKEDNHDKTENLPPMTLKEMTEDTIDAPWHEILFMSGKKIRDRGNREPQNTWRVQNIDWSELRTQEMGNCETCHEMKGTRTNNFKEQHVYL